VPVAGQHLTDLPARICIKGITGNGGGLISHVNLFRQFLV